MRMQTLSRMFLTLALFVLPATAHAQFVVYTDLASFLARTAAYSTDTFDDLVPEAAPNGPLNRNSGIFRYTADVNTSSFYAVGSVGDTWLSANVATDIITFSGFDLSARGLGGFFFSTDVSGAPSSNTDLFVTIVNETGMYTQTLVSPNAGSFFGVLSNSSISSMKVEVVTPTSGFGFPTVNNFTVAVVPEPSTFALFGVGSAVLVLLARRRRNA